MQFEIYEFSEKKKKKKKKKRFLITYVITFSNLCRLQKHRCNV